VLAPLLAVHGITLRAAILDDPGRTLLDGLPPRRGYRTEATARLHRALDDVARIVQSPTRRVRR